MCDFPVNQVESTTWLDTYCLIIHVFPIRFTEQCYICFVAHIIL